MKFPSKLQSMLTDYTLINQRSTRLGGQNFQYQKGETKLYLKSGQGIAGEALVREFDVLTELNEKGLVVPKVVEFVKDKDGFTFLLQTGLEGQAAHKAIGLSKNEILELLAIALKDFHSIKVVNNQKLRTLDHDLEHIHKCISLELLNTDDFFVANNGQTPNEVYSYLNKLKDIFSKDIIVHGDFCMPNIIFNGRKYGFIDVGDCGPGDPYKDLSALEVSIKRNFGEEWIENFYQYYDSSLKVDPVKIKYFQFIDQFGYHLNLEKYKKAVIG